MARFNGLAVATIAGALLVGGAGMLSAQTTAPTGNVAHGHQLFVAEGCYECHDYNGQGSGSRKPGVNPGPNLAPAPIPFAAFIKQVRTPRQSMPPYDSRLMTDQDVADIYAYLASQPPAKDAHSIALLNAVTVGTANVPAGAVIYAANCAACHGAQGQGGIGPALRGESSRRDASAVAAFVKNPSGGMTKLYPGLLSDGDVAAVTTYVESLH